jgi:SpoVK/Ycf46/Vps4 family AAA+-type ATPase
MVGKEEAAWLNPPEWVHWYRRAIRLIGELPRSSEGKPALSKKQLELCPPRVLGFAVSVKKFVQLLVKNIDTTAGADKKKKEQPFDDLELATKTKKTLRKLVEEHSKKSVIEDLIPGKGQGLVVLLHGPPGVGKTLTAESLAILTDKPLYSVSMADIGTSPHTVEFNLRRIFQLATHWKALLLFDEADVFLEARSLTDVRRNSLVSTLLRILEYYEGIPLAFPMFLQKTNRLLGILFLTSNRVKTFDEAFQSRIHFAVQFSILTEQQRKKIWEMWFKKASDKLDPSFEWQEYLEEEGRLVKEKLNGRQIRNVFRSAM